MVDFSLKLIKDLETPDVSGNVQAYEPVHMKRDQIMTESSGQQKNPDGSVKVGRYRDGTMPNPEERAYGIAQMQVATARRVAAAHGIKFDMRSFMNDADYNLRLGDLHMGDLKKKYGDEQLARAAYHSGEGNVDRAIAKYGRARFHEGLGPEGRAYIGKGGKRGGSVADSVVAAIPDPRETDATPAEKAAMSQPGNFIRDPFTAVDQVRKDYNTTRQRISVADAVLSAATEESQAIRQQQEEQLRTTVEAKNAINEHQAEITKNLAEQVTPMFQRRVAIAERRAELADMNPLEQGLRSIFDPNYNDKYLRGLDRAVATQINAQGEAYKFDFDTHTTLANLAQSTYDNNDQLMKLQLANLGEDVRLAVQSYSLSTQILDNTLGGLQADSQIIAAQTVARNNVLSGLSIGQANELLSQAKVNGGKVVVNGVELRTGELTELQTKLVEQEYGLASRQLALQAQQIQLAEVHEDRILDTMSKADVQAAIAAGGEFKGQQFDVTKLGARLEKLQATEGAMVQQTILSSAPGAAKQTMEVIAQTTRAKAQRLMSMFGNLPEEYQRDSGQLTQDIRLYMQGYEQAKANGTLETYAATTLPQLQALLTRQDKVVEGIIDRWSGGNKFVKAAGMAWTKGEPLDSGAAMRGLIHMARNGLPAGTRLSGPAAKVMAIVSEEVKKSGIPASGTSLDEMLSDKGKESAADKEAALIQRIQGRVAATYNQSILDTITARTVEFASRIRDPKTGQAHPMSRVKQEDFLTAIHMGDEEGWDLAARTANMRREDFERMLREGPEGALWKSNASKFKPNQQSIGYWTSFVQSSQYIKAMDYLDTIVGIQGNFRPSQAWRDLIRNPQFQDQVRNENTINQQGNFGGFIASQAASGGFDQAWMNTATTIDRAYSSRVSSAVKRSADQANALKTNPLERTRFMLGAISGLSQEDEAYALAQMSKMFPLNETDKYADPMASAFQSSLGINAAENASARIDQWILNGKSDDPRLERIRRHASKQWGEVVRVAQPAVDKYFGGQ